MFNIFELQHEEVFKQKSNIAAEKPQRVQKHKLGVSLVLRCLLTQHCLLEIALVMLVIQKYEENLHVCSSPLISNNYMTVAV